MAISIFPATGGDARALLGHKKIDKEAPAAIAKWYAWGLTRQPDEKTATKGLPDQNAEKVREATKKMAKRDKRQRNRQQTANRTPNTRKGDGTTGEITCQKP